MTDCNHSSIVVFSLKIAVKQAGDHSGMSPNQAGVVIKTPASAYSVGMHHENASLHPRVPEFIDPFNTRSERAVIATETFGLAVVQEMHRNVSNPRSRNLPFLGLSSTIAPAAPRVLVRALSMRPSVDARP